MKRILLVFFLPLFPLLLSGQVDLYYYLPQNVTYDAAIPTPKEFLGYEVGDWHVTHDQLTFYLKMLAQTSDRIEIEQMGSSHEGKALMLARITSVTNQKNIEALKSQHQQLSDPARSGSLDVSNMPVVIWLGHTIHGDEASGAQSAMLFAYYLAAARGNTIDQLLNESIILLDPCMNPDGMSRFASWANSHKSKTAVTDAASREFSQAWPGGRTNHYWFDLNRDWLPGQHPESQARLKKFHEWKPNLLSDHHEMGSNRTFFFQPGIPSRNNPLTPQSVYELTTRLAAYHAKALDKLGSLYYTQESYDDYYIGKGATYPDLQGSVGILFEQAGVKGHARETPNGILKLPFAIRNQLAVSISTIEGGHAMREAFLSLQKDFFTQAKQKAKNGSRKAYLLDYQSDVYRAKAFWEILNRHQIKCYQLERDVQVNGKSFSRGNALLIPTDQAQYTYLTAIFERRTQFQDSLFYDVSSWTLPLAFGLEDAVIDSKSWKSDLLGDEITQFKLPAASIIGGQSQYAYAFKWDSYLAPRLLYQLQQEGLLCKVSMEPLQFADGTFLDRGSIFISVASQEMDAEQLLSKLERLATETGVSIYALSTGFTPQGIDLGSPQMEVLRMPKIALLVDGGVHAYEAGEVWHLLDTRYHIPVTHLPVGDIISTDLSRYNTLIMTDGNYASLREAESQLLRNWVEQGGTLICWKRGAQWAGTAKLTDWTFSRGGAKDVNDYPYESRSNLRGAQVIGGAIFSARIDATHPLGFGYPKGKVNLFRNNNLFLQPKSSRSRFPLQYETSPLLSGYISDANLKLLAESAGAAVHPLKRGRVIGFSDNPNFRAFWYGTNKLFANAIFFGEIME